MSAGYLTCGTMISARQFLALKAILNQIYSRFVNNLPPMFPRRQPLEGAGMFYRPRTLSLRNSSLSGRLTALLRPRPARIGALAHDRKGVSAVEFGLAAPVFLA